jgi:hypothetical protein
MMLDRKNAARLGAGLLAVALVAGGGGYWLGQRGQGPKAESGAAADGRKILYWYDPMVPAEHYDNPDSLSSMGMKTIPKYAEAAPDTALLQRLAAVTGRLSLCADQAAAAKWWLSMSMASVSAEGPMPKALSTRRTSPLMPGCRHQGRACPLRRARMTSNPLIVA